MYWLLVQTISASGDMKTEGGKFPPEVENISLPVSVVAFVVKLLFLHGMPL